jgi:hypothetical protein
MESTTLVFGLVKIADLKWNIITGISERESECYREERWEMARWLTWQCFICFCSYLDHRPCYPFIFLLNIFFNVK